MTSDPVDPSFADATAVEPVGDGLYAVTLAPEWGFGGRPNGGYLLAIAARAAVVATGRPHPHVVSGSFVRAPEGGPAEVRVELVRAGRQITHARATLYQKGGVALDALVALGSAVDAPPSWVDLPDARPAPFEQCPPTPYRPGRPDLLRLLDIRYDPAAPPSLRPDGSGDARVRGWVALADGTPPDVYLAVLAADVLPASVYGLGRRGWVPTVHMSVYLRAVPAPGPLGVSVAARLFAGEWFDEVADVYDSSGTVVAQARQLSLLQP